MTFFRDEDYEHSNDRGNGPKKRLEGGDQTDDISINDPQSLLRARLKKHLDEQARIKSKTASAR